MRTKPLAKEIDYLVPTGTFLAEFLVFVAFFVLLAVRPLLSAALRRQWGWVLAVVLLVPLGGILWFDVWWKDALSSVSV